MPLFGSKLVERRLVKNINDIPTIRPDETMKIITFIPEGDQIISDYDPEEDSNAKLRNLVTAHLRLGKVPPPNPPAPAPNPPVPAPNPPVPLPNPPVPLPNPVPAPNPPVPAPNPPVPAPNPPQLQYAEIYDPSHLDLLVAARSFNEVARRSYVEYAIIGGFAAVLYGGTRPTKSLDILLKQCHQSAIQQIQLLFNNCQGVLKLTPQDHRGQQHIIIVTAGIAGIRLQFFDCANYNNIHFPNLVLHGTYDFYFPPTPQNMLQIAFPVLLPRYLLLQRILHFGRDQTQSNDYLDIYVFLKEMRNRREAIDSPDILRLSSRIQDVVCFGVNLGFHWNVAPWCAVGVSFYYPTQ